MKLYYSPGACSLSPHIVARESGLPIDLVKVDLGAKKTASGEDFTAINPKGYVPALKLDDGALLTEGSVIVQYLADRAGKTSLLPAAGKMERYRVQEMLNFVATELHKTFGPFFSPDTPDSYKESLKKKLLGRFAMVDKELAGKDYLTGKEFSVADAYLYTIASWRNYIGLNLDHLPNLSATLKRIEARPAVQAALKAEAA